MTAGKLFATVSHKQFKTLEIEFSFFNGISKLENQMKSHVNLKVELLEFDKNHSYICAMHIVHAVCEAHHIKIRNELKLEIATITDAD